MSYDGKNSTERLAADSRWQTTFEGRSGTVAKILLVLLGAAWAVEIIVSIIRAL